MFLGFKFYLATGAVISLTPPLRNSWRSIFWTQLRSPGRTDQTDHQGRTGAMRGFNTEDRMIHNQITIDGQAIYDAVKKVERRVGASMLTRSAA